MVDRNLLHRLRLHSRDLLPVRGHLRCLLLHLPTRPEEVQTDEGAHDPREAGWVPVAEPEQQQRRTVRPDKTGESTGLWDVRRSRQRECGLGGSWTGSRGW